MKVFISGPMSGKPYYNRAAFFKAEEELEKHGYSVWNPAWMAYPSDTEFTKDDMHIIDFAALRRCDAIYMLKGWKHSKGAQEECEYAIMRGLMIMYEGAHCWGKEPVFDQEFAYDEAIKNRTNYQLEAIKENVKEKYTELKTITRDLRIQCNTVDIGLGNESDRINALEGEVDAIKESIGTDNLQEQLEKDFADVYEEFQDTKDKVNDINMGYIKWSSEVSQFDERIEKLEENMKEIAANGGLGLSFNLMNERVSSNKRDISSLRNDDEAFERRIKALEKKSEDCTKRMNLFSREIETYEEAYKQLRTSLDNNDNALEKRIKAIEKRLSIKPFYEPTEDEKDD